VVLAYVAMLGASLALQYKEALAAITPFPDNDEVLTSKVKTPLACIGYVGQELHVGHCIMRSRHLNSVDSFLLMTGHETGSVYQHDQTLHLVLLSCLFPTSHI